MVDDKNAASDDGRTTSSDAGGRHRTLSTDKADVTAGRGDVTRCSVPLFTANASCVLFLWMVGVVYTMAVIRTLERRFGLRSTQTGVVVACGDIVHMCIVVFVGYFGRRGHKPRIMCVMAMFSAVGNAMMVLPHWLYNDPHATTVSHCTSHRATLINTPTCSSGDY